MEPGKLKEIILKSLTEEVSEEERKLIEREVISDQNFSPGFGSGVMSRLEKTGGSIMTGISYFRNIDFIFKRIAITGIAAILILAISLLLSEGSLSYDTILGIDSNVDDGLISLLVE